MTTKKIKKPTIIALIIIAILLVAFAIFLPLYLKANQGQRELYEEEKIKFVAYGEHIGTYTLSELLVLDGVKEETFKDIYDTSTSEAVEKTYTGIELKTVLKALEVDATIARDIILKAKDGANKIYSAEDVFLKSKNVFIAYKVNGVDFNKGIKANAPTLEGEDGGPFVVIRVADTFSQHRCKLLTEIEITN